MSKNIPIRVGKYELTLNDFNWKNPYRLGGVYHRNSIDDITSFIWSIQTRPPQVWFSKTKVPDGESSVVDIPYRKPGSLETKRSFKKRWAVFVETVNRIKMEYGCNDSDIILILP